MDRQKDLNGNFTKGKKEYPFCSKCGQRIPDNRYNLSKNLISRLFRIRKMQDKALYVSTKELMTDQMIGDSSGSANLTQLEYFGAIRKYFTNADLTKKSKRSGKWEVSKDGLNFLNKTGSLPSYVVVKKKRVVEKGKLINIDDAKLKWKTEDDIWKDLIDYWESRNHGD